MVSYVDFKVDTAGPHGELIVAIWVHLARLKAQQISERTNSGMARRRAQGLAIASQLRQHRANGGRYADFRPGVKDNVRAD